MADVPLADLADLNPELAWSEAPPKVWNLRWAAHLYRRAAFGGPPLPLGASTATSAALKQSVEKGMVAALEDLFVGADAGGKFAALMDSLGERIARSSSSRFGGVNISRLQGWWLYRMLFSPHPLQERMTLFWHNHFATSVTKVGSALMMIEQNRLLRRRALGRFEPLVQDVARDPAMLFWLDTIKNTKGNPNENFARELMELFTLGVGNYTEQDVKEAARAFTGWSSINRQYSFNAKLHDDGVKTVLGRRGNWNGDDVIRIVLGEPAVATFVVRKLYREFISDTPPPESLIEPLANQFRKSGYDISDCLKTMLRSRLFFSRHAYRQRIKGPVEYVVGLMRALDGRAPMEGLAVAMEGMGQSLFEPPNVKGWDGGTAWLNSATLLARHNLAWRLVGGQAGQQFKIDPPALIERAAGKDRDKQIEFVLELLLQSNIGADSRKQLTHFAEQRKDGNSEPDETLRKITHAVLTLPEYQLA